MWFSAANDRRIVVLLALFLGNVLTVALLWGLRSTSRQLHSGDLAAIYFSQGQFVLLAAWCAWGTGRATTRWLMALASLAAVMFAFNDIAARSLGRYSDAFFDLSVGGAVSLAGWYALFMPLRWLFGWRLSLDRMARGAPRGQFRLKHWLAWTAALGVPLAVARLLSGERMIECLFFCAVLTLPAMPFVVLSFRAAFSPRPWLWSTVAVAVAILVGIAEESFVVHCLMDGSAFFTWQMRWMHIQQMCSMNLGLLAGLLGNLLLLRLIGLRFVPGKAREQSSESRGQEITVDYLVPRTE